MKQKSKHIWSGKRRWVWAPWNKFKKEYDLLTSTLSLYREKKWRLISTWYMMSNIRASWINYRVNERQKTRTWVFLPLHRFCPIHIKVSTKFCKITCGFIRIVLLPCSSWVVTPKWYVPITLVSSSMAGAFIISSQMVSTSLDLYTSMLRGVPLFAMIISTLQLSMSHCILRDVDRAVMQTTEICLLMSGEAKILSAASTTFRYPWASALKSTKMARSLFERFWQNSSMTASSLSCSMNAAPAVIVLHFCTSLQDAKWLTSIKSLGLSESYRLNTHLLAICSYSSPNKLQSLRPQKLLPEKWARCTSVQTALCISASSK